MIATLKKLTWDDIKDWPEYHGRTEIVDGELVMSPVPSDRHQEICLWLGVEIGPFVRDHGLGKFWSHPVHVILDEHVHYEPDMCFLSTDRLYLLQTPHIAGAPDLIIEVISESNRSHDTVVKFRDYERYGVREYWLVDQRERHIRVYCLEEGRYVLLGAFGPGDTVATRVLEGLALDPARIF